MCAQSAHEPTDGREDDALAKRRDDLIRRLGEQRLEQLVESQTSKLDAAEVQLPPEACELKAWLSDDRVEGKFTPWWPQRIATARELRLEVPLVWKVLASSLDRLAPDTCNTFNEVDPRRSVTEEELFAYLKDNHGLSNDQAKDLNLTALSQLLHQDLEDNPRTPKRGRSRNPTVVKHGSKETQGEGKKRVPDAKIKLGQALQFDWLKYRADEGNPNDENEVYNDWRINSGLSGDFDLSLDDAKEFRTWFVKTHARRYKKDGVSLDRGYELSDDDKQSINDWITSWRKSRKKS